MPPPTIKPFSTHPMQINIFSDPATQDFDQRIEGWSFIKQ